MKREPWADILVRPHIHARVAPTYEFSEGYLDLLRFQVSLRPASPSSDEDDGRETGLVLHLSDYCILLQW